MSSLCTKLLVNVKPQAHPSLIRRTRKPHHHAGAMMASISISIIIFIFLSGTSFNVNLSVGVASTTNTPTHRWRNFSASGYSTPSIQIPVPYCT